MTISRPFSYAYNAEYDELFRRSEAKQQQLDQIAELARRYDSENEVNSRLLARQILRLIGERA